MINNNLVLKFLLILNEKMYNAKEINEKQYLIAKNKFRKVLKEDIDDFKFN